jgi:hypothetical protein
LNIEKATPPSKEERKEDLLANHTKWRSVERPRLEVPEVEVTPEMLAELDTPSPVSTSPVPNSRERLRKAS